MDKKMSKKYFFSIVLVMFSFTAYCKVWFGLSTYCKPELYKDENLGVLSVWEKMDTLHGSLGTAVLVNRKIFAGAIGTIFMKDIVW